MKSIALKQHEAAAYAAGRLTQLRQVCRPQPVDAPSFVHYGTKSIVKEVASGQIFTTEQCIAALVQFAPYGAPGDRLALREMFSYYERGSFKTPNGIWYWADGEVPGSDWSIPKSSTQMPLWAVRWHPVITAVRLERVQEMTEGDAVACGIQSTPLAWHYMHQFDRDNPRTLWESNPWTWVVDVEGVRG